MTKEDQREAIIYLCLVAAGAIVGLLGYATY